jgi:four helix bundle protein
MKNKHHNFRELNIWKNGMKIVKSTYHISKGLPGDEKFGLTSQIQRCSVSIPSNIAEGSGRSTSKDFIRFINIGLSSSYELETQLILVNDLYKLETDVIIKEINELQRMIIGFKRSLSSEN